MNHPTDLLKILFGSLFLISALSCTKKETIILDDNQPPIVNYVPAIKIENYINRIFIDLLGREPLDSEMQAEVAALRADTLSVEAREALIIKLQTSTDFIEGDTSYQRAFAQHMYNLSKVRCIEGASNAEIRTFFNNASEADSSRLFKVLNSRRDFQNGDIQIHEMFARMIHNLVYDQINMNSFNFVNATFDNLLWRFPTDSEFKAGFDMVEFQLPQTLFNEAGENKTDYVEILTESREMFEGILIWTYQQLLARRPTTEETFFLLEDFFQHRDLRLIQRHIMVKDEYANF